MPRSVRLISRHLIGVILSLLCAGPVLAMAVASVRTSVANGGSDSWSVANYTNLLSNPMLLRWMVNSLVVALAVTFLLCLVDVAAAYVFVRIPFRGRSLLFSLMLATLMLPFAITLIPTYLLAVRYNLIDTYAGMILPALASPLGVFLLRQYLLALPRDLFDAAVVDGASHLAILRWVVVPLARQPLIVLAVLTLVASWNSFLWPLLIGQTDEMKTLPVGIATMNLQYITDTGSIMAQAVISLVPMAILFAFFQRAFIEGATAGATKG